MNPLKNPSLPVNDDLQVERIGNHLNGKTIALCVTGGIAAIETPKIARHLRRYGAEVKAYVTPTALQFVGEMALEWATGKPVISKLSGLAEHICLEDLVLVAPATYNSINSIYVGIADSAVTTLIASALGKKVPVLLAPTMHKSMYDNPILQENLKKAPQYGLTIIPPRISEGKAKMPHLETLVAEVCRSLAEKENHVNLDNSVNNLYGKKILITGGHTPGKIDEIRSIGNKFKGALAVEIAKEAYLRGAEVILLLNKTGISLPPYLQSRVLFHEDYHQYTKNVFAELEQGYDAGIFSAAVADYIPTSQYQGKIPSCETELLLRLQPTKKVIKEVREKFPELFMVTFKYEDGVSQEELLEIARKRIGEGYQIVVANRAQEMQESHCAYIVGKEGVIATPQSKKEIAERLLDTMSGAI